MKNPPKIPKIKAVFPALHVRPYFGQDFDLDEYCLSESEPSISNLEWTLVDNISDISLGLIHDFIQKALTETEFSILVEIAAAHIVASKALSDPWFRMDRYKTRIDEWVMPIWELAQEIYENNADLALPYQGARSPTRRAVGLEAAGRRWASGCRKRAPQ